MNRDPSTGPGIMPPEFEKEEGTRGNVSLVFYKEALLEEEAGCQLAVGRWCYVSDSKPNLECISKSRFRYYSEETFFSFLFYGINTRLLEVTLPSQVYYWTYLDATGY